MSTVKAIFGVHSMTSSSLKVTQLHTDLWVIEDILSNENSMTYVLCGNDAALVFDTGLGRSPVLPEVRKLTQLPLIACLSHWHFDHSGAAHEFAELVGWNSPAMHQAAMRGISSTTIESEVGYEFWESVGEVYAVRAFPQIRMLSDIQTISLGGYKLEVIHTPGHTKDSLCLYEPHRKWLFSGDTIYHGPIYLQFEDSSVADYEASIKKLCGYDVHTIFPGHNHHELPGSILKDIDDLAQNPKAKSKTFPRLSLRT